MLYASGFVAYFFNVIFLMGLSAILIVGLDPDFFEGGKIGGKLIGGGNMVAMHLAKAVGGNLLLGFLAAVAFATILAVVSGLALAGASAISHDLYARVIKKGKATEADEIRVSKIATIGLGIVAIALGILFEKQNVAFMVGLAFGVAAAANFPVLILSMYWKGLTTRGALAGRLRRAPLRGDLRRPLQVGLGGGARATRRPSSPTTSRPSSRCPSPSSWPGRARRPTPRRAPRRSRSPSRTSTSGPRPASAPPAPASTDPGGRLAAPQSRWW